MHDLSPDDRTRELRLEARQKRLSLAERDERETQALWRQVEQIVDTSSIRSPGAVCLCLGGNQHNILGLRENPIPFCVGENDSGCVPDGASRHFIPYQLMRDIFDKEELRRLARHIFEAFPGAKRFYLNPPPPLPGHMIVSAQRKRSDTDEFVVAPEALRLHLYRIQSDVMKDMAAQEEAMFIEPDESLLEDGFLAPDYCADQTHGNVAYGDRMLRVVLDRAGVSP